ncbi:MAG: hypothetical protein ACR2QU_08060 [Gammaproteobacteria bacterium]
MTEQAALQQGADIRVFEEALPGSLFERLVRAVRAIGGERLKRNYTTTFWLPMGAEPTNVAEEAAIELSRLVGPTSEVSGLEWWLGRLGQGERLRLHFDRDMTLRKKTGEFVHPVFASVFYLNSFPASPTVILGQTPSPDGKTRVPEKPKFRKSVEAVSNRYVVFPGNLRHGVLPDSGSADGLHSAADDNSIPELRLTLLLNYWAQRPLPPICFDYDGSIYGGLQSADVYPAGHRI